MSNSDFGLNQFRLRLMPLGQRVVELRLHAVVGPVVVVSRPLHEVLDQRLDVNLQSVVKMLVGVKVRNLHQKMIEK